MAVSCYNYVVGDDDYVDADCDGEDGEYNLYNCRGSVVITSARGVFLLRILMVAVVVVVIVAAFVGVLSAMIRRVIVCVCVGRVSMRMSVIRVMRVGSGPRYGRILCLL